MFAGRGFPGPRLYRFRSFAGLLSVRRARVASRITIVFQMNFLITTQLAVVLIYGAMPRN